MTALSRNRSLLLGGLIVVAGLAAYFLMYWNHFVGYRAGGGQFIAWSWMINHGYLPYKDFFIPAPPFYPIRGAVLLSLFGNHFIATRVAGLVERCLLGLLVYLFLARIVPRKTAVMPALTTVIMGSSDCADPLDVYTQEALLFSIASIFSAASIFHGTTTKKAGLPALLSGFLAGLAFFTKQTIGAGSFAAALVAGILCTGKLNGWKQARDFTLAYGGGFIICTAIFCGWLAANGILGAFIDQAFISGPAAKAGSAWDFIQRFIDKHYAAAPFFIAGILTLAISARSLATRIDGPKAAKIKKADDKTADDQTESVEPAPESPLELLPIALTAIGAVALGGYLGYQWTNPQAAKQVVDLATALGLAGGAIRLVAMYFTYYGLIYIGMVNLIRLLRGSMNRTEAQILIFTAVAFADATMVCLSFPFYEAVLTPGLAILLTLLYYRARPARTFIIHSLSFLAISGAVVWKLHLPYFFEDFCESPASKATMPMKTEEMAGFVLPPDMALFLDETTRIVKENSKPEDCIYVFPEGSLLYPLTGRRCPTFSMSHNMDTTNDKVAERDANLLLANPPKVLIYYKCTEATMKTLENRWRRGKKSGLRKLIAACETLASKYKLMRKFPFPDAGGEGLVIEVYVRQD